MSNQNNTGSILLAHGSRDSRWLEPFQQLKEKLHNQNPNAQVQLAFLELAKPTLNQAFDNLKQDCPELRKVLIFPLFLSVGKHLNKDIPEMVQALQTKNPEFEFILEGAIGENELVQKAMCEAVLSKLNG